MLVIFHDFIVACFLFFKIDFLKKIIQENYQSVSNGLETDQDRHHVGPDLGPNCLQKLTTDSKGRASAMIGLSMKIVIHDLAPLWIHTD